MAVLALATLGDVTDIGSFLFCPRWLRQVQVCLSLLRVTDIIALNFANGNTALRVEANTTRKIYMSDKSSPIGQSDSLSNVILDIKQFETITK